jgi:NRPS condensation-like uncharacterized protein
MLRNPGIFERALILSDKHSPFNVISVLRMENPPEPDAVRAALTMLQRRHPFLSAAIQAGAFVPLSQPGFRFSVLNRHNDSDWLELVEQEMNTRLDVSSELWRGLYLFSDACAELILTFHHATMDAASGMNLLDELLTFCAAPADLPPLELIPPVETRFPPGFKGARGLFPTLKYAAAQMADEAAYWLRVRGKRVPAVRSGGRGFATTLTLPELLVDALSRKGRQTGLTLNSLLNAALTLALNRHLYASAPTPMRTFTFADLRPYTVPPTPAENLANYISMLRFTLDVSGQDNLWQVAQRLQAKIYPALKHGDKFIASAMSEGLMKTFLVLKTMRMGAVGLNYSGAVTLKAAYGRIRLKGVHGFLSSYDIGPEVSAQARLFNDELWIDFMFREADMSRDLAGEIIGEVKDILEEASSG